MAMSLWHRLSKRGAIITGDRDNVALRPSHTGYFFVQHDRVAITDQRSEAPLSLSVNFPRFAL